MSQNRFQLIPQFWHFSDNTNSTGHLGKLENLLDHFNQTMKSLYVPDQDFSLDESMVL